MYATGAEEAAACAKALVSLRNRAWRELGDGSARVRRRTPLTTRTSRERVTVLNLAESKIDWARHVESQTLVLLSPVKGIGAAAEALMAAGRDADTPVSMTSVGTTTEQRTIVSTLANVAADTKSARLAAPAVTVIGEVVAMRDALSWFETKPLFGWRILVPRTREQAGLLSAKLRGFGGVPEEVPTISVEPAPQPAPGGQGDLAGWSRAATSGSRSTSVNALKAVREKFDRERARRPGVLRQLKVAAVGDKTAEAIATWGINADLGPSGERVPVSWRRAGRGLAAVRRAARPDQPGVPAPERTSRPEHPGPPGSTSSAGRSTTSRPTGPCGRLPLRRRHATRSRRGSSTPSCFTSSSTVRNLVGIAGKPHASTVIAAIGPATAKACEEHGLRVDVLAPKPSVELLADALADFGAARRLSMIEAGVSVTKPSERRPSSRRRTT